LVFEFFYFSGFCDGDDEFFQISGFNDDGEVED
jgi:hypothetical protein